jgi:hypothetical protein
MMMKTMSMCLAVLSPNLQSHLLYRQYPSKRPHLLFLIRKNPPSVRRKVNPLITELIGLSSNS